MLLTLARSFAALPLVTIVPRLFRSSASLDYERSRSRERNLLQRYRPIALSRVFIYFVSSPRLG